MPEQHGVHDSRTVSDYWSVSAEGTWTISTRLKLITGARWYEEDKEALIENSVTAPGASIVSAVLTPVISPSGESVNGRVRRSSSALSWSVTSKYRANDRLMAYVTASRSEKAGGFNNGTGNAPLTAREFDDETVQHYELGARVTSTAGRIQVSGAIFRTDYHDYQDAVFLLGQFAVGNVERVDLSGFELAGRAQWSERIALDASVSYVDLEYARHTTGVCYPSRPPDGSLPQSCNLSGEHPMNAPPWESHAGLQYSAPARWGEIRVDWSWTDRYHTTFSADSRLKQDDHHDLGVRVGGRVGDAYEITFWARNLLNEDVVQIASTLNFFNDASWQSFLAEPRSYGVTVRARFR